MKQNYEKNLFKWCKDLFPICRSITGNGIKYSLRYFENINSSLKRLKFKTGSKIFDWTVPMEWNIEDAYILDQSGKKYAEFKKSNLHVVNFSGPINKWIDKNKLLKKIFVHKKNKNVIPYVTSYYKKSWGFCLSYNQKKKLEKSKSKKFKVFIKSSFKNGYLDLSHAVINGRSKKEIFFSSYLCHPSMANNELSGPVVLNGLLKYLKLKFKTTYYTYRFVILPETIGSISYLSKYYKQMKKNLIMGYNISCVGDNRNFSIIKNIAGEKCLSFKALYSILKNKKNLKLYDFIDRGSDERQYCSPNINLPVCGFSRSKYGKYSEYHTSEDNLNIISNKSLNDSLDVLKKIIDIAELSLFPKLATLCEPNLSSRGLYPTISKLDTMDKKLKLRKNLLAYSNGKRSIFDIMTLLNCNYHDIYNELKILKTKKILK